MLALFSQRDFFFLPKVTEMINRVIKSALPIVGAGCLLDYPLSHGSNVECPNNNHYGHMK